MKRIFYTILMTPLFLAANYSCEGIKVQGIRGGLDKKFLQSIVADFQPTVFVETGTYVGETIQQALDLFQEIYTIELDQKMFEAAKKKFATCNHIHVYNGESGDILEQIIPAIENEKILFWLDAHYSHVGTAYGRNVTSILEELMAIKKVKNIKNCVIIIDDVRGFSTDIAGKTFVGWHGYPSLQKIYSLLKELNGDFEFILLGDSLLAYPKNIPIEYSPACKNLFLSRIESNCSQDELLAAEACIASLSYKEKEFLHTLYTEYKSYNTQEYHVHLWFGLILLAHKKYSEAADIFKLIINRGFNHERVYWYLAQAYYNLNLLIDAEDALYQALYFDKNFDVAKKLLHAIYQRNSAL